MSYGFQRAATHQANWRQEWRQFASGGTPTIDRISFLIPKDMPKRFIWWGAAPHITAVDPSSALGQWSVTGLLSFLFAGSLVFQVEMKFGRNTLSFTPEPDFFVNIEGVNDATYTQQSGSGGQPALSIFQKTIAGAYSGRNMIPCVQLMLSADTVLTEWSGLYADATAQGLVYGAAVLSQTESL